MMMMMLSLAKKIQWLKLTNCTVTSVTHQTHPSLPLRSRPIYSWLGIHYGRLVLTLVFKNRKRYRSATAADGLIITTHTGHTQLSKGPPHKT